MCCSGHLSIPLMVPVGQNASQLPGTHLGHPSPKGAPGRSFPYPLGRHCQGLMRDPGAGQAKANKTFLLLATAVTLSVTGWVKVLTWGGGNDSVLIRVGHWSTTCPLCEWFVPNPVSRATAASTSPRSAQAQVTTAGNASCPADKWYHFNYTNSSSRAAAEIILGSHGLRLKHHLITLMNCCLTLCLTLSSQRELPAQHLLSQRTHGRARSSHLLINCSSSCAPLMRAVSGACQPLAAHHCQASNVSHEPRALPASLGFWKQNLVPFYGTQCTKVT